MDEVKKQRFYKGFINSLNKLRSKFRCSHTCDISTYVRRLYTSYREKRIMLRIPYLLRKYYIAKHSAPKGARIVLLTF